jgi:hypothetical protein
MMPCNSGEAQEKEARHIGKPGRVLVQKGGRSRARRGAQIRFLKWPASTLAASSLNFSCVHSLSGKIIGIGAAKAGDDVEATSAK